MFRWAACRGCQNPTTQSMACNYCFDLASDKGCALDLVGAGEEDEEEEFLSSDDSSSDEEDAEAEPALDSASKQRALEEARALLRDEPRKKNKSAYFEDEVRRCMCLIGRCAGQDSGHVSCLSGVSDACMNAEGQGLQEHLPSSRNL